MICDKLDINVWELIKLANHHPRVNILQPGPGVGGHCIAVDPWFLVASAPELTPLIQAARRVNDQKPDTVVEQIISHAIEIEAKTISFLGLTYKADIDDLRESPAVKIVKETADKFSGNILVCEPNIKDLPPILKSQRTVELSEIHNCLKDAEIIVLLTNHKEFKKISSHSLSSKSLIDTRGFWRKLKNKLEHER